MRRKRSDFVQTGFTLIEMMVVVAIIAIVALLAMASLGQLGSAASAQSAAHELQSNLDKARMLAADRGTSVWVVVYPERNRAGAVGEGAYFIYEDRPGSFDDSAQAYSYENFDPPALLAPPSGVTGRLVDSVYLQDYDKPIRFDIGTGSGAATFTAPFAGLNGITDAEVRACSFCTDSGADRRGALVFEPDGTVRFLDADGAPAAAPVVANATSSARAHSLGLTTGDNSRSYLFGISGPTSFVGFFGN